MTTTLPSIASRPRTTDASRTRRGVTCTQLNNGLWRITRDSGQVLGYVEQLVHGEHFVQGEQTGSSRLDGAHDVQHSDTAPANGHAQVRFQAKRLASTGRSFLSAGEFWSFDDAVDCLRFS